MLIKCNVLSLISLNQTEQKTVRNLNRGRFRLFRTDIQSSGYIVIYECLHRFESDFLRFIGNVSTAILLSACYIMQPIQHPCYMGSISSNLRQKSVSHMKIQHTYALMALKQRYIIKDTDCIKVETKKIILIVFQRN